jgi:hypothetical protein
MSINSFNIENIKNDYSLFSTCSDLLERRCSIDLRHGTLCILYACYSFYLCLYTERKSYWNNYCYFTFYLIWVSYIPREIVLRQFLHLSEHHFVTMILTGDNRIDAFNNIVLHEPLGTHRQWSCKLHCEGILQHIYISIWVQCFTEEKGSY